MSKKSRAGGPLAEQVLVLAALLLVAFGAVMVYSASSSTAIADYNGDSLYFLKRHGIYAVLGLLAFAVCSRLDYRWIGRSAPLLLAGSVGLLALVAAAGVTVNGAQRWLAIGPLSFQPSELAKLAVLVFAATTLAGARRVPGTVGEVMRPVGWAAAGVAALLAGVQSDLGSAIAVMLATGAVLLIAGVPGGVLARIFGVAFALGAFMVYLVPYRRERMLAFLDPFQPEHVQDGGYQVVQALVALGRGGLTGVGLGEGMQKSTYLPEAHTDMIFATIGEELGLVGICLVLLGFLALAWAGFTVARRATDPFGKYLAGGVTALICGQAIVNIGGVTGALPLTGVPLPLLSYGGTALVTTLASLGLVVSVARHGAAVRAARAPSRERREEREAPRRATPRREPATRRVRRASH